jgi:glycosyltransferase involved in cell wall biosynthesis
VRNVVEELIRIGNNNEYFLYISNDKHPYYERFRNRSDVHLYAIPGKNPFLRIPLLGLRTFKDKIDVLHVQYIAPPWYRGKLVVMIHDLAFLHFPQCFNRFERMRSTYLIPKNGRKADAVLTVSQFSKNDIVDVIKIDKSKIEVTYNGIDPAFNEKYTDMQVAEVLQPLGIRQNYILSVGRLDPRKNLVRLIAAYIALKKEHRISHKLVIVGKKEYLSGEITKAISGLEDDIIMTGYVPAGMLPLLYRGADVFVYPTLFEGFGLPCLEAMACGCPVVSSKNSSIPEVVGSAGMLVDPYNVDEIAAAILSVISNKDLRVKMNTAGIERARQFSWENTARRTLDVYERVVS